MKLMLYFFIIIFFCPTNCFSQDSLEFEKIVEAYYSEWNITYGNESAKYGGEFYKKNGYPPLPHESAEYRSGFYKKHREKFVQSIKDRSLCMKISIDSIKKRLMIIEYGGNRLRQDTMIALLIDELYEINTEEAISFSLERFGYFNVLDTNRNRIDDPYNIKEYPYIYSLYSKMSTSRFIGLILESDINEELINLCTAQLVKDFSDLELEEIKIYAESFIRLNKIKKYNTYFVAQLKELVER